MLLLGTTLLFNLTAVLYIEVGWAPVIIVGLPGIAAIALWAVTYLRKRIDPSVLLGPFLLSAAGFELHAIEEYVGCYGPAVGRIFGFAWTEPRFVGICFVLAAVLSLVTIGLLRGKAMAGLAACRSRRLLAHERQPVTTVKRGFECRYCANCAHRRNPVWAARR